MKNRLFLICFAVAVSGFLGSVGPARAQDRDNCGRRVRKDQQDLAKAINQHGYYSSQAQHERAELQRDAANCGYVDSDDRWRNNRDSDRQGAYGNYDRRGYDGPAFDIGYRDGVAVGQKDRGKGKAFRPDKNDYYEDADHGYQKGYGQKDFYKSQYREAFERGYSDGYGYRR
jgi:hypothetical protein